jgi:hypothetical protein
MGIGAAGGSWSAAVGVLYDIIAEDKTGPGTRSAVANLAKVTAAFAAITAASAGALAAADRVTILNRESSRAAQTLGINAEQMRQFNNSLSDATTPIEEVIAGTDLLVRNGERNLEVIRAEFEEFDQLGDALGEHADIVISEVIPALSAFGIKQSEIGNYQDVFTHVVRNTTMDLSSFTGFVERSALNLQQMNLGLIDVAAIFEVMAQKGIQGRQAASAFNDIIQAQTDRTRDLTQATKDYEDAQKRVNDLQKDATKLTKRYHEDMSMAGNDVGEMRRLTVLYNRAMEDKNDEIAKEQAKMNTAGAAKTAASKPIDIYGPEALGKFGVTKAAVDAQKGVIESSKGTTDILASTVSTYTTASEKAAYATDQLAQILGQNISPQLATMLPYLETISGGLSILGGLGTIGGLLGIGKAGTGAAAGVGLATAGAVAAGAGLGGAIVYGMETQGLLGLTGPGYVRSAGGYVGQAAYNAGRNFSLAIQNMNLSKDYPADRMMSDLERWYAIDATQKGVPQI